MGKVFSETEVFFYRKYLQQNITSDIVAFEQKFAAHDNINRNKFKATLCPLMLVHKSHTLLLRVLAYQRANKKN